MKFSPAAIQGIVEIDPRVFGDARGYFFECYNRAKFAEGGIDAVFVQDNESFSTFGVVRGLHYQLPPFTQAKLIRVIEGEVFDVAVDLRRGSPTFGKYWSSVLSSENRRMVYIPRGFAHGFAVRSEKAVFTYKCDNSYAPSHERSIRLDDPDLGIDWGIDPASAVLSEKDKKGLPFREAEIPEDWTC